MAAPALVVPLTGFSCDFRRTTSEHWGGSSIHPSDSMRANGMAARANQKLRTFHATMVVTRVEEWCVDAASAEEAKALLDAGQGHRCSGGDALHVEVGELHTDH